MQASYAELNNRSLGPDALRGIACSCVVIHHMAHFTPEAVGMIYQIARMFLGLGVPLFFMISAFAMQSAYKGKFSKSNDFFIYFVRRVMRIYPLYFLMLAIFVYFFNTIEFNLSLQTKLVHYLLYASLFFGLVPNLAHGLVWASWSISVEILFYIVSVVSQRFHIKAP
jgi:peptidoglycan/LPS O-acetylase OafA/YrhL